MGRSKPPAQSSAPPRVKITEHFTENSSPLTNTFTENARQDKSDAAKMSAMQMDPPGGRRRMGRAAKVQTPESESSLSPVEVDPNDGGNMGAGSGAVNAPGSECRRSSRKKTIKFDVRDLLNKNRKSHKIQIEARIDSNAPKSGAGPASKEELDNKQKTFIEKSAIFRRYSFSENKQPPRPPPPPVALIKTIQQCVGELEQLPLDRDLDLAAISPIARRLSRTQEILTASMMKPKQVNSLIVTKLENATTSTPATTRKGARQKQSTAESPPPTQVKRRGRPKKGKPGSDSMTESSNDSTDISETAIVSNPIVSHDGVDGKTKPREDLTPINREISISPTSSTKAIDLIEKTDASAVTLSPSELMESNMFVGAEEEVFTQGLSSDESTVFLRGSPKEKSNDEVSLFGRSDSTETNSSDDSERRRKKIRVSVKRVTLPSALKEHVDLMVKNITSTKGAIEVRSSNDNEILNSSEEASKIVNPAEMSANLRPEESSQDSSKSMQTRGSSNRQPEQSVDQLEVVVECDSNSMAVGSIVEISSDSTATPVEEVLTQTKTASPQTRVTPPRRSCRRQPNEEILEVHPAEPARSTECKDYKEVQELVSNEPDAVTASDKCADITQTKQSTKLTKKSVQKQQQEVPSLPIQEENSDETETVAAKQKQEEKSLATKNAACSLSPRTRSQKETQAEITENESKQSDSNGKSPETRRISLRKRKDAMEEKETDSNAPSIQKDAEEQKSAIIEEPKEKNLGATGTEKSDLPKQEKLEMSKKEDLRSSPISATERSPTVQRAGGKTQQTGRCLRATKISEGRVQLLKAIEDSVSSSDVETQSNKFADAEASAKKQGDSSQGDRASPSQTQSEKCSSTKESSPVTRKTTKASKHLARVLSTDQSSSSSERSESPKGHLQKKSPESKEDTSSICSESSSVESSSSSSFSSTTASSKSSSTSTSSSSNSSTTSTSSTSSSSVSDMHGRTTRSRRSQHLVLESAEDSTQPAVVSHEEQSLTGPESENSKQSLRRGKVKASEISPKERAKLVQRRRSVRANRFQLEEESNETSSESSGTSSSTRLTRTARSRARSEIPSALKKTSRSVECMRSPKATTESDTNKDTTKSPKVQKTAGNLSKDSETSSGEQTRFETRPKKKLGRFAPLKGISPERTSYDETSVSTMRETRGRRKTISSASELEELLYHRITKGSEQKKQGKNKSPALEEVEQKVVGKKAVLQEELKAEVPDEINKKTDLHELPKADESDGTKRKEENKNMNLQEQQKAGIPKEKEIIGAKTELEVQSLSEKTEDVERSEDSKASDGNGLESTNEVSREANGTETEESNKLLADEQHIWKEHVAENESKSAEIKPSAVAADDQGISIPSGIESSAKEARKEYPVQNNTLSTGEEMKAEQSTKTAEAASNKASESAETTKEEDAVKTTEDETVKDKESQREKENSFAKGHQSVAENAKCALFLETKEPETITDFLKKSLLPGSKGNMETPEKKEMLVNDSVRHFAVASATSSLLSTLHAETNSGGSSTEVHDNTEESTKPADSKPTDDIISEGKSKKENSKEMQTPRVVKKPITPRKKKKAEQQESQKSANEKDLIPEASLELGTTESSNSEDSQKSDVTKSEAVITPCRQLDSSVIDSLEKSVVKTPAAAKKAQKKKEKPQPVPLPAPKEKEEPQKKLKKNQEKADVTATSPKSKKKLKDTMKAEKKAEIETPNKRKAAAKNKSVDVSKSIEASEEKTEVPENKVTEVAQPIVAETTAPQVSLGVAALESNELPAIAPPKPMKSKGETKFYPDEHLTEEKLNATTEACSTDDVQKEKSPDPVPDPLKDIEKFIEDGVNLLKRGYKLDESEESSGNSEVVKPDETTTPKKCKLDESSDEKKQTHSEDDNSNSNSEHSLLTSTPNSDVDTPNGIRRSHRIKNNSKSAKCLVGRGLVRDRERFSMKDDEKTIYSIDDQKMDLAEVEAKNSKFLKDMEERLSNFRVIRENEYKCERVISKEAKRMLCDCFLTAEEEERGELGCGEDCLNRLLMIECGSDCTVKERCTNRRFTKFLYSPCRVFRTEKKGFGIMADIEILPGEFIMEYVGEVIDGDEFERRRNMYSQDKNKHYYFMALRSDAIIDATAKGNVSRFINHSCDPNAETQKWTVNGELRIGFFSRKSIMPGEEITFDYQYQRYGKEAQKCYCESSNCRGWIGEEPSSEEEEEEEEEMDEEEGESETEEEEVPEAVLSPAIPLAGPPIATEGEQLVTETPVVGKDVETSDLLPVFTQVTVEPAKPPTEAPAKKKKEKRRQLERKEEKIKRRETKQYLEDPDIEDEVRFLVKCGLKNQADTLRLSRLIVRAKLLGTRLKLLQILRAGELPCRRLFLDYHGLRLLHGWMSEVIDTRDTEKSMEIRMALLSVLECLPISNKTMLTDSKVYQTVRDWSNNKESHSPNDESPKDSTPATGASSSPVNSEDSSTELQKLAAKLVSTWDSLPEVFRIPKRERIEQMKEHEREADRQYKGLAEDVSGSEDRRNRDRFFRNGPNSSRFKWSRSEKDKERERDRRRYLANGGSGKDNLDKTQGVGDSHLSKEQRRELFAAKVARDEAEKRLAEERREFDIKCRFFGLDPKRLRPENMPFCVNPSTGQWYSTDKKPISTPPSYAHVQVPVKPKSTNPADYQLPIMDLPPQWKFAISPKGKIYYYHVKIRIPQWEPPIKILPLAGQKNTHAKASESDSSNADCVDSSDDDMDVIKGLDTTKLQAYIEKKIEDRRLQRYNRLVEEKPISPRKEEDRIYNQMEVRKYKENKEKIRKRKEEIRRRRDTMAKVATTSIEPNQTEAAPAENDDVAVDAIPIQDYLLSSDEEDKIKEECNNSPLIDKIVQGDKIVDELDALQCKRPLKRALPIREKYEHKKRKLDKNKESTKSTKRSKDGEGSSSSSKYRKIREKFRCEIAGIIVQHLRPYRKETCFSGRILTDDDFNHLARKLTHFVMVKELKYCESIGQTLVVTESVKNKSREFIKKYMAKYGGVYVRPQNDPEFKEIPFL